MDGFKLGTLPAAQFIHEPAASQAVRESTLEYPRSEIIPGDLIDAIITEQGVDWNPQHSLECQGD